MTYKMMELDKIDEETEVWGGKAISNMKLIKVGVEVPKGFVISSDVYEKYMGEELDYELLEKELELMCEKILGGMHEKIIVRSSANIEGSEKYSCCGVFESCIFDADISLVDNVKKVWDSVKSHDAKSYFDFLNFPIEKIKMSVIVQKLIEGDSSSVIQTFDIVNDRKRIIVEYSDAGIESIVDGSTNASVIYLDYECNTNNINDYVRMNKNIINQIISDCKKVEEMFNSHVELEAQISGNEIYYVQARAV